MLTDMQSAFWFSFCSLLVVLFISFGHIDKFKNESDALARLNSLETKVTESWDKLAETDIKLTETRELLADSDIKLTKTKYRLSETEDLLAENGIKLTRTEKILAETNTKLTKASDTIVSLTNQLKGKAHPGSTYIRWGRTTCPANGTELVYSGIAGGAHYTHGGGAVNYMCLPRIPVYGKYYEDAAQDHGGYMYGAEYQFTHRTHMMKFFPGVTNPTSLLDNDVPCAVCKTARSLMLMVPAQNMCMDDWTLEYKGMLVSGHYTHSVSTEFICLDGQPEVIHGRGRNDDGKLFYFVEGRCGSLPCPPYVNGRELTCAVCTK